MNGELYQSLMLTNSTHEILVNGFECGLRFFVVGGGGDDGGDCYNCYFDFDWFLKSNDDLSPPKRGVKNV